MDLWSRSAFENALLMRLISISKLFHLVQQEAQSTSVLKVGFFVYYFIPFHFTFSFVDFYANMLFCVKPYLCYPVDYGML